MQEGDIACDVNDVLYKLKPLTLCHQITSQRNLTYGNIKSGRKHQVCKP